MTIGKIYCAKLIYENYKHIKKKRLEKKKKVRRLSFFKVWELFLLLIYSYFLSQLKTSSIFVWFFLIIILNEVSVFVSGGFQPINHLQYITNYNSTFLAFVMLLIGLFHNNKRSHSLLFSSRAVDQFSN